MIQTPKWTETSITNRNLQITFLLFPKKNEFYRIVNFFNYDGKSQVLDDLKDKNIYVFIENKIDEVLDLYHCNDFDKNRRIKIFSHWKNQRDLFLRSVSIFKTGRVVCRHPRKFEQSFWRGVTRRSFSHTISPLRNQIRKIWSGRSDTRIENTIPCHTYLIQSFKPSFDKKSRWYYGFPI